MGERLAATSTETVVIGREFAAEGTTTDGFRINATGVGSPYEVSKYRATKRRDVYDGSQAVIKRSILESTKTRDPIPELRSAEGSTVLTNREKLNTMLMFSLRRISASWVSS